jgi:hypothetical protein
VTELEEHISADLEDDNPGEDDDPAENDLATIRPSEASTSTTAKSDERQEPGTIWSRTRPNPTSPTRTGCWSKSRTKQH